MIELGESDVYEAIEEDYEFYGDDDDDEYDDWFDDDEPIYDFDFI